MEKYIIDFKTGVTWELEVEDIEVAKAEAENGMEYTKEDVVIKDPNGRVMIVSRWNGVQADVMDDVLFEFGSAGFYSTWEEPGDWD
ncbi:hypothetical protein H9S87_18710 (plasmid) [Bacillus pumilus]|uniref:hypothetical protein n=1 Tax=Bacillus pumilus TaxID=1408 RepID=UPI001657CC45|nr:hypothetical protein [Bacillus pumilus]QNP18316.1 hypothetical protein H9S87_18710 [Bacillus pumilus]